jgi:hypothetical protein
MKGTHVIACASLLAVAGQAGAAKANVISDNPVKANLKQAICEQDWQGAIALTSQLMASSTITPEHRQELVDWRQRFSSYAASGTYFDNIPNCEGYTSIHKATYEAAVAAAQRQEANRVAVAQATTNQIKADLKSAICEQNWQAAAQLSGRLMASDNITSAHRQELVKWRHQFSQYAASSTYFDQIPNCGGTAGPATKANDASLPLAAAAPQTYAQPARELPRPNIKGQCPMPPATSSTRMGAPQI